MTEEEYVAAIRKAAGQFNQAIMNAHVNGIVTSLEVQSVTMVAYPGERQFVMPTISRLLYKPQA